MDVNDFDSRFMENMMKKWRATLLIFLFFLPVQISFAQGVRIGPDGEFSPQTLKLPYAFYNESFGFAAGYVYGKVGRVAPEWSFSRLHSDMKWDAGLGIRALAQGIVIRIDTAYSDEGVGVQMMIAQPFQF
ncbi:MAG: hypothetical protein PVF26_16720 [Desulfobacterales bacterium]|jgi:hypothetical protein